MSARLQDKRPHHPAKAGKCVGTNYEVIREIERQTFGNLKEARLTKHLDEFL